MRAPEAETGRAAGEGAVGGREAFALGLGLAVAVGLRGFALTIPTMHLWGLNASRFLAGPVALGLFAVSALAMVPALARPLAPSLAWLASGSRSYWVFGVLALVPLSLWPDRLWFVGDHLLRLGILAEPKGFGTMFPQALPLDPLRHYWLPRALGGAFHFDPALIERALGVLEGLALALLAVRFARILDLQGAAAFAASSVVLFGGYFTLFTGYGKPTIEVCLFTAAAGVFGLEMIRHNRGAVAFGLSVAAALAIHRAAWSMIPGVLVGWAIWLRVHRRDGTWRSAAPLVGFAIPLVTTLALLPKLLHLFFGFDVGTNFSSNEVRGQGGILRAALSPLKLLDIANLVLLFCPVVLAIPLATAARRARTPRAGEILFLGALALSYVPSLFLVYVTQGPFRDWDAFAGAGVALALVVAWCIGEALRDAPRLAWLALPVALGSAAPTLALLLVHHDPAAGLARTRAFLTEPPRRTASQRLATFDFLGLRAMRLHQWADAASAYGQVSAEAPHARALEFWGVASALDGRYEQSRTAFSTLCDRVPDSAIGWAGLWMSASFLDDTLTVGRARRRLEQFADDGPELAEFRQRLAHSSELDQLFQAAQRREVARAAGVRR